MVPPVTNSSDSALGTFWAGAKNLADACFETQKTTGNLIGTAFTARDIMSVVDVLEDDGKLRYWGECKTIFSRSTVQLALVL